MSLSTLPCWQQLTFYCEENSATRVDFAILIVGAMPGLYRVSPNKQQRRCNGCVRFIPSLNETMKPGSRNLSFFDFRFVSLRR